MKRLIMILTIIVFLTECIHAEALDNSQVDAFVGTYVGVHGSSLIIYQDGTADYYWKGWADVESGDTWLFDQNRLSIHSKSLHYDFYADIPEGSITALCFRSNSLSWDDEYFIRVSSKTIRLSKNEHVDLINSILLSNIGEDADSGSRVEALELEALDTGHFTISVPSRWNSAKKDNTYTYSTTTADGIEKGLVIEVSEAKNLSWMGADLILDTLLEKSLSNVSPEDSDVTTEKVTINGISAAIISGSSNNYHVSLLLAFNQGYIIFALYMDSSNDVAAISNAANDIFYTLRKSDDAMTQTVERQEFTLREGKYIIGEDIVPGNYTITCIETTGESMADSYDSLGGLMDELDDNKENDWSSLYGALGGIMREYMNTTVKIIDRNGDTVNTYTMKKGDSFTIILKKDTALEISDGSCTLISD